MVNLTRNKRTIYLCKKKENSIEFEKPIEIKINRMPTYSSSDTIALGINARMYQTIKCTPKVASNFSNSDRVYLQKPVNFRSDCNDADYFIYGDPMITLNEAEITMRKMNGEIEDVDDEKYD